MGRARFHFHGVLEDLLPAHQRGTWLVYDFRGAPSLKHALETFGVPHPEIGAPSDLHRPVRDGEDLHIFPHLSFAPPGGEWRFLLDCHLGRLAKYLRILGFDTLYEKHAPDDWLASTSHDQRRMLLTMDRGLLMRSLVEHGALVRSATPRLQLAETIHRFRLQPHFRPLRRCLRCNALLAPVPKSQVLHRIPPKTRLWCEEFLQCPSCAQVYWPGSHHDSMLQWVALLRQPSKSAPSPAPPEDC